MVCIIIMNTFTYFDNHGEVISNYMKIFMFGAIQNRTRKGGNYSDVLPLKADGRNSIWGFKSELQINPMPFHLESLWGAPLVPDRGVRWTGTEQYGEGGWKLRSGIKPFVDQGSWNFGTI